MRKSQLGVGGGDVKMVDERSTAHSIILRRREHTDPMPAGDAISTP